MQVGPKCGNIIYDVITIFISIADVTTDVIILIEFYQKERMIFFAISLAILILAQCSYAIAFALRFDTIDQWGSILACTAFWCLLPFGTFVAFCIYFGSEESDCLCFRDFLRYINLDSGRRFIPKASDSHLVQWIKRKLDKHLGFILEAVSEAVPQSLLQIVAIVYYQEANYISILSILLSQFSVMTKSLILSQGIEKYTFIWTWLCVVTDFFGIFFTLTWVFYTDDLIHGDFLGYFNIFGAIWLYKVAISTLLPVALALICFFAGGVWVIYFGMMCDPDFSEDRYERCGFSFLWLIFSPIIALLCTFATCLGCEVFCFSIVAMAVYSLSSQRIAQHRTKDVTHVIALMLAFILEGRGKDRTMRVLAINRGLDVVTPPWKIGCSVLRVFIDRTMEEGQYEALSKVTYKDIRQNCNEPSNANLLRLFCNDVMEFYTDSRDSFRNARRMEIFFSFVRLLSCGAVVFVFGPILLVSKIIQILYPWIILIYLVHQDLMFTNQINTFQLVMLVVYIVLQLLLLFLGIYVFQIHFVLWHVECGVTYALWSTFTGEALMKEAKDWYNEVCWYPATNPIVVSTFGNDIAHIIMYYCKNIVAPEMTPRHV